MLSINMGILGFSTVTVAFETEASNLKRTQCFDLPPCAGDSAALLPRKEEQRWGCHLSLDISDPPQMQQGAPSVGCPPQTCRSE